MLHKLNNHAFFIVFSVVYLAFLIWLWIEIKGAPVDPDELDEDPKRYYNEGIMDEVHKN